MDFDPALLGALDCGFEDESRIVELSELELRRVADTEMRRLCGGLKAASRIVGIAAATRGSADDQAVLASMQDFVRRLHTLRQVSLGIIGVASDNADYANIFNAVTDAAVDVLTEEWKWSRVSTRGIRPLSPTVIAKLLDATVQAMPERFDAPVDMADELALGTLRKLCVLEAIPKLFGLSNLFDYYQCESDALIGRLLQAVVEQAELYVERVRPERCAAFVERAITQRLYGVACGLMCEVYKATAYGDVANLRSMSELDRSIFIAQYERLGGMPYEHVIDAYRSTMARTFEVMTLVLESQGTNSRAQG